MYYRLYNSKKTDNEIKKNLIYDSDHISIETDSLLKKWTNEDGEVFIVIGKLFFQRQDKKIIKDLTDLSLLEDKNNVRFFEGRYIIIKIFQDNKIEIWNDKFSRLDLYWYYSNKEKTFFAASSIDLFKNEINFGQIDQLSLSQVLTIYGNRPLKKQTLFRGIKRLGVNESLLLNNQSISVNKLKFFPKNIFSKNDLSKLDDYSDKLIQSVEARASNSQNIIFLSSGWDSTSILAILVHLYGSSKIDCIIGRMKYSKRSGIINQFELDRAKKIAEYFKVKLHIVELDYTKDVNKIIDEVKPIFRGHNFGNMTGFNHYLLAKGAKKIAIEGASIFAGEISDGAHNLGFSQYFSIFHPESHSFREYSDKMASYLFGPTFLKQLINNKYQDDPVWKIFKLYNSNTKFDTLKKGKKNISFQLLSTFFLSGGRIPLYSKSNTKMLTEFGVLEFSKYCEDVYLKEFKDLVEPENIYSIYLHLYNSFHWQGGTVATLEYICDHFNLTCHLPFLDTEVIELLSEMPESWGRGLDINNTKFPLKWMLKNKIDYPMNLQEGPHSYIYDVDPSFSHASELVNASSLRKIFESELSTSNFIEKFDPKIFDIKYIKSIILKYKSGKDMDGEDITNILSLGLLSTLDILK